MTFEDALKLKTGDIVYTNKPLEFEFGKLPKFAKLTVTKPYSERAGYLGLWLTAVVDGPVYRGQECEFDKLDAATFLTDPDELFQPGQAFRTQKAYFIPVSPTSAKRVKMEYASLRAGTRLVVLMPFSESANSTMTAVVHDEKDSYDRVEVVFNRGHLPNLEPIPVYGCSCCSGDEPVFATDDNNCVFVSSQGNMLITLNGSEMSLKVKFCPICGKPLGQQPQNDERGVPV